MKAILYARGKTESDIEAQQEANRRYAQASGLTNTVEVSEVASGIGNTIPPKLCLYLHNLRSQGRYVLVCVRPDKLSRRPSVLSQIFFQLYHTGGLVLYSGWPNHTGEEEQRKPRTA